VRSFIFYTPPQILLGRSSQGDFGECHVACMGEKRNVCKVLMGKPEGKNHLEDQGIDGRMGSGWILGRLAGGV
jgi:hypothetical protein